MSGIEATATAFIPTESLAVLETHRRVVNEARETNQRVEATTRQALDTHMEIRRAAADGLGRLVDLYA